jgi:hypothetical protein
MRRALLSVVAWTARVGGWALVLALLTYVAWKHEGLGVRGQMIRLTLPSERARALRALLQQAGIHAPPEQFEANPLVIDYLFAGPEIVLRRRSSVLHLSRRVTVDDPPTQLRVCFDSDGRLAGAPVELTGISSLVYFHFAGSLILEMGSLRFLPVWEALRSSTSTPASGPVSQDLALHVFQLGFPASVEVLTIRCTVGARQFPVFVVDWDDAGNAVLNLVLKTYTTPTAAPSVQTLASFTWAETRGRFVGPQRDPQGRWEVLEPQAGPAMEGE